MIGALGRWLMGIVLTSLAASLAETLAAGRRQKAMARLAGGMLILLAMLTPLQRPEGEKLLPAGGDFAQDREQWEEQQRRENRRALASVIEERTAAYICDKAAELGLEIRAEVITGEQGDIPLPESVRIWGTPSSALEAEIRDQIGIDAIVWEGAWKENEQGD